MNLTTVTSEFKPACDDELCEVHYAHGGPDDVEPRARLPVAVTVVWSAGRWTCGRLWMDRDGCLGVTDGPFLGDIIGHCPRGMVRTREEYAEEIDALREAWERHQEDCRAVRAEEEGHYGSTRL